MSSDIFIITKHKDGGTKSQDTSRGIYNLKGYRDNIAGLLDSFEKPEDVLIKHDEYMFTIEISDKKHLDFLETIFTSNELKEAYEKHYTKGVIKEDENEWKEHTLSFVDELRKLYTDDVVSLEISVY